ncbi:MAG: hypothetical protein KDD35_10105 [Bdellovibrionales bacterium]|nr:hypothetical protein [Bdellovibrionales bacterium]
MSEERIELVSQIEEQTRSGFAIRRDFSNSERIWRALKVLAIGWGIGLFAVIIPMLHFILVPLFVLGGLILSVVTWFERGQVVKGEVSCPNCGSNVYLSLSSERWPRTYRCPSCYMSLSVRKSDSSAS